VIDDADSLTVRDLLEIGVFGDATLLAGERGVGTEVADVRLAADMTAVEACSAGDLVILTGHQPYLVEVALRRAYSADVRAVVLVRPTRTTRCWSRTRCARPCGVPRSRRPGCSTPSPRGWDAAGPTRVR
jgi:hypothetical protein